MGIDSDGVAKGQTAPADIAIAVTPSDSVNFSKPTRGIYIGNTGDISVEMAVTGNAIVFKNVLAGTLLPIRATRVNATSTTATDIVALS